MFQFTGKLFDELIPKQEKKEEKEVETMNTKWCRHQDQVQASPMLSHQECLRKRLDAQLTASAETFFAYSDQQTYLLSENDQNT